MKEILIIGGFAFLLLQLAKQNESSASELPQNPAQNNAGQNASASAGGAYGGGPLDNPFAQPWSTNSAYNAAAGANQFANQVSGIPLGYPQLPPGVIRVRNDEEVVEFPYYDDRLSILQ